MMSNPTSSLGTISVAELICKIAEASLQHLRMLLSAAAKRNPNVFCGSEEHTLMVIGGVLLLTFGSLTWTINLHSILGQHTKLHKWSFDWRYARTLFRHHCLLFRFHNHSRWQRSQSRASPGQNFQQDHKTLEQKQLNLSMHLVQPTSKKRLYSLQASNYVHEIPFWGTLARNAFFSSWWMTFIFIQWRDSDCSTHCMHTACKHSFCFAW